MFKKSVVCALLVAMLPLSGCALFNQHAQEMDVMRATALATVERMDKGAFSQYTVSGAVDDPGIVVEFGIIYRVACFYKGVSAQASASAAGTQAEATDEGKARMYEMSRTAADEAKSAGKVISDAITGPPESKKE